MKFVALHARGFRAFKDFTFECPQAPGLYVLTGRNEKQPSLGSNGCGKSSVWDAISTALHGESTRGLRGKDLVHDGCDGYDLEFTTDAHVYRRAWATGKKMVLQLDGADVSQDEVTRTFGLDHEMTCNTVLIPQAEPLFTQLPPVAQVAVLQRLLGLERWLSYAELAAKRGQALEREIATLSGQINAMAAALAAADIATLEGSVRAWHVQHAKACEAASLAATRALAAMQPAASLDTWRKESTGLAAQLVRCKHNAGVHEKRLAAARDAFARGEVELRALVTARQTAEGKLRFFDVTPTCPACEQPITATHKATCRQLLLDEIDTLATDYDAHGQIEAVNRHAINTSQTALRDVQTRIRGFEMRIGALDRQVAVEEQRVSGAQDAAVQAGEYMDAVMAEKNPHLAALVRAQARHVEDTEKLNAAKAALAVAQTAYDAFHIWTRGFKAIRSQLVGDALAQFSLEIAAVLDDLGLQGWQVAPRIDPAVFASARVQTGFEFVVTEPDGIQRVLKAYSGGELQRAHIAVQLGLGALVAATAGVSVDFEVYDEHSTYMSAEGVQGLLAALRGRAERLARPIFVVDHHTTHTADAARVYTLVKRSNGHVELES